MKINKNDLNKKITNAIKRDMKSLTYKSRGGIFFEKIGSYFITISIGISGMKQDQIKIVGTVKPYIIDDIFWEVFQMSENCNAPMGLRANGAFKVDGLTVFRKSIKYKDQEEIEKLSKELFTICNHDIRSIVDQFHGFDDFMTFASTVENRLLFDYDLVSMLLLINDAKFKQAMDIAMTKISNNELGRFKNHGKYINEHIYEYCKMHLDE